MKKYLRAFMTALIVMLIFTIVSKALIEIPNFMIGWLSCMGWYLGMDLVK